MFFLHDFRRQSQEFALVESSDEEANKGSGDGTEYFLALETETGGMYAPVIQCRRLSGTLFLLLGSNLAVVTVLTVLSLRLSRGVCTFKMHACEAIIINVICT